MSKRYSSSANMATDSMRSLVSIASRPFPAVALALAVAVTLSTVWHPFDFISKFLLFVLHHFPSVCENVKKYGHYAYDLPWYVAFYAIMPGAIALPFIILVVAITAISAEIHVYTFALAFVGVRLYIGTGNMANTRMFGIALIIAAALYDFGGPPQRDALPGDYCKSGDVAVKYAHVFYVPPANFPISADDSTKSYHSTLKECQKFGASHLFCSSDSACGEGSVCFGKYCYQDCATADCPEKHTCLEMSDGKKLCVVDTAHVEDHPIIPARACTAEVTPPATNVHSALPVSRSLCKGPSSKLVDAWNAKTTEQRAAQKPPPCASKTPVTQAVYDGYTDAQKIQSWRSGTSPHGTTKPAGA